MKLSYNYTPTGEMNFYKVCTKACQIADRALIPVGSIQSF